MDVSDINTKCLIAKLARMPKSRLDFWKTKLDGNRLRDTKQEQILVSQGRKVAVICECETKNTRVLESAIRDALEET
jgi:DNA mismatch endonuclease, patch repair protein